MSKFKFSTTNTAMIGGVRVSEENHHKVKSIAQVKGVTIQEVVRVLIDVGLEEFDKEYPEHFFSESPTPSSQAREKQG